MRALRTQRLRFGHFLRTYEEPLRTSLGTDVARDFRRVFALSSRSLRAQ